MHLQPADDVATKKVTIILFTIMNFLSWRSFSSFMPLMFDSGYYSKEGLDARHFKSKMVNTRPHSKPRLN